MRKVFAFLLVALLPMVSFAGSVVTMNLSEALKKEMVKMEARSNSGQYTGKAVTLTITNTSSSKLEIKVDLGIILKPYVPSIQPLVLAGEEVVTIKARGKEDVDVQVFCGDAPKACPIKDLPYTYLKVGSDTLIKVLQFIKANSLYDFLGQSAVWCVTNKDHSLDGIYDEQKDAVSKQLTDVVAQATGKPKPTYYTVNEKNETPAQPAYTAKTIKLFVPLDFTLSAPAILTVGVYDLKGHLLQNVIDRKMFAAGRHNLMQEIKSQDFERGKYIIKLSDAEKTLQEKQVQVK